MRHGTMVTTCAWCRHTVAVQFDMLISDSMKDHMVNVRWPIGQSHVTPNGPLAAVESHGICIPCRKRVMASITSMPVGGVCSHGTRPYDYCETCAAENTSGVEGGGG